MKQPIKQKQSGFIILMSILLLILGSAAWFGTASNLRSSDMKISLEQTRINELKAIKQRMLTYAVLHPELFADASIVPGPGYFPCPDLNGDGSVLGSEANCGSGVNFVIGMVPHKISSRVFTFIEQPFEAGRYWYALDARFVNSNPDYTSGSGTDRFTRFAPLNTSNPATANLSLDGVNDYVMILFYSGEALSGQNQATYSVGNFLELENADGDANFISAAELDATYSFNPNAEQYNDYVIGITRDEWQFAVLSRLAVDNQLPTNAPDLCTDPDILAGTVASWFEACENDLTTDPDCPSDGSTIGDNRNGQDWRVDLGC